MLFVDAQSHCKGPTSARVRVCVCVRIRAAATVAFEGRAVKPLAAVVTYCLFSSPRADAEVETSIDTMQILYPNIANKVREKLTNLSRQLLRWSLNNEFYICDILLGLS